MADPATQRGASPEQDDASGADRTRSWAAADWESWFQQTVIPSDRWKALRHAQGLGLGGDSADAAAADGFARDPRTGEPDPGLRAGLDALSRLAYRDHRDGDLLIPAGDTAAADFARLSAPARQQFMAGWERVHAVPGEDAGPDEETDSIVPELSPLITGVDGPRTLPWRRWAIPIVIGGFIAGWAWLGGAGTEDDARRALTGSPTPSLAATSTPRPTSSGGALQLKALIDLAEFLKREVGAAGGVRDSLERDFPFLVRPDEPGRPHDSVSTRPAANAAAEIDQLRTLAMTGRFTGPEAERAFGPDGLRCGGSAPTVVCAPAALDFPGGDVLVVAVEHQAAIPVGSDTWSYQYGLVFDSDGDPANDWPANPPFDWDFYQGTDRWYQATYDHTSGGWTILVTQLHESGQGADLVQPSATRAVLSGEWLVWFVPVAELPTYPSPFRTTSFIHDGKLSPESRGGDVSGGDPTEALVRPPELLVLVEPGIVDRP